MPTSNPRPHTTAAAPSHCSGCIRPPFAWSTSAPNAATTSASPSVARPRIEGGRGGSQRARAQAPRARRRRRRPGGDRAGGGGEARLPQRQRQPDEQQDHGHRAGHQVEAAAVEDERAGSPAAGRRRRSAASRRPDDRPAMSTSHRPAYTSTPMPPARASSTNPMRIHSGSMPSRSPMRAATPADDPRRAAGPAAGPASVRGAVSGCCQQAARRGPRLRRYGHRRRRTIGDVPALGVGRIILTNAERVERPYFDTHILDAAEYRPLLIEGLQQARDARLPLVWRIHRQFKVLIEDHLDMLFPEGTRLMADPAASTPIDAAVQAHVGASSPLRASLGAGNPRVCSSRSAPKAAGIRSSARSYKSTASTRSAWATAHSAATPHAWRC